jgi:hypothetical protein
MICQKCQQKINRRTQIAISCSKCSNIFHNYCNNSVDSEEKRVDWQCDDCVNTSSPVSLLICELCDKFGQRKSLFECSDCLKYYHKSCLSKIKPPHISTSLKWIFPKCKIDKTTVPSLTIKQTQDSKLPRGVKFGHANVRSILTKNKKEDVKMLILLHNFDVFIITESWLKPEVEDDELQIQGYQMFRHDRPGTKEGGGVLAYVKESWRVNVMKSPFTSPVDSLFIKLDRDFMPPIHIVGLYRPQEAGSIFFTELESFLLQNSDTETYILGDANLDQLTQSGLPYKLKNIICTYGYKQIITQATRVTQTTETLLDLIIVNNARLVLKSGVWKSSLADHDIIYVVRKCPSKVKDPISYKYIRKLKNVDKAELLKSFEEAPWWALDICPTVNKAYAMFVYIVTHILDIHAPVKKMKLMEKRPQWWTQEYEKLTRQANTMRRKAKKGGNVGDWLQYKTMRNYINHLKKKLKANIIQKEIDESDNSPKTSWRLFNNELGRKKPEPKINHININGTTTYDQNCIVNEFAKQFTEIPQELHTDEDTTVAAANGEDAKFHINNISTAEIVKAIKKLKQNKPPGYDQIPCSIFKMYGEILAPVLEKLFTRSLESGEYPELMKISIVFPLYKKKGSRSDPKNYRSIALIPIISKIFEMVICEKLCTFLTETEFFDPAQHGFRKDHSTLSAIMTLLADIYDNAESNNFTGVAFLDYTNAFGLADHNVLLKKLAQAGLASQLVGWFSSYLKGRYITVKNGENVSEFHPVFAGVPAGSNLGPVLYAIFVNDLPKFLKECSVGAYADDVRFSAKGEDKDSVINNLNENLHRVKEWSDTNKCVVNVDKTVWMLFYNNRSKLKEFQCDLKYNNETIKQVEKFKFLGVRLDSNLKFIDQFDYVTRTMSARIRLISRYKHYFDYKYLKIFCSSLVLSLVDYCLPVWSYLCNTRIDRLNAIVMKMIECNILNRRVSAEEKNKVLEQTNVLLVNERRDIYGLEFIFKHVFNETSLSPTMQKIFVIKNSERNLRDDKTLHVPIVKSFSQSSCFFQLGKLWNSLPITVKAANSFTAFDLLLRQHIIKSRPRIT